MKEGDLQFSTCKNMITKEAEQAAIQAAEEFEEALKEWKERGENDGCV